MSWMYTVTNTVTPHAFSKWKNKTSSCKYSWPVSKAVFSSPQYTLSLSFRFVFSYLIFQRKYFEDKRFLTKIHKVYLRSVFTPFMYFSSYDHW